jgi:cell division septation protein DedD
MRTEALQHNTVGWSMMWKAVSAALVLAVAPLGSAAAQGSQPVNPAYRRAQTLVNDGNVQAGRALIDSMIAVAQPGSNDYAEGVYWRAVLAATAADAEMDYRRIVVDYPSSPRVDDALIRLAQLEIARGNYDGALKHLARISTERPDSPSRARAGYWSARAMFDKNDIQGGCIAIVDALARTNEADTELRNQINYLNQRCAGVLLTQPAPAPAPLAASPVVTAPVTQPAPAIVPDTTVTTRPSPAVDSAVVSPKVAAPVPPPVRIPKETTPAPVEKEPASVSSGEKVFSVQIAAYNVKSQADAMVAKLKKSGYEARVDGKVAPFRVRIGKYATQAQANAVQRSLKAKQITGFVVQAEIQ